TEALGPFHHYDPVNFPEIEKALDAMMDRYVYWRDHYMDFGWFDYFDVHCGTRNDDYCTKVKRGSIAQLWRHWDSTHYGFPNNPWLLYYRSGKRKYLHMAEANSRHCMDIDRCHYDNKENWKFKGAEYYCDWSFIHWNGKHPDHINYNKLEYMLFYYYMRGYRRGLEVMKDWGNAYARLYKAGITHSPLQMISTPKYSNRRHFGPPLGNMTELFRATYDMKYLTVAFDYVNAIIEMVPEEEKTYYRYVSKNAFCWESEANYLRLMPDDNSFKKTFLTFTDRTTKNMLFAPQHTFADAGHSWFINKKDPLYLDIIKTRFSVLTPRINISGIPAERGTAGIWTSGLYPYIMRSVPIAMAALAQAPQEWRSKNLPLMEKNQLFYMMGEIYPWHAAVKDKTGKEIKKYSAAKGIPATITTVEFAANGGYTLEFDGIPVRNKDRYATSTIPLLNINNVKLSVSQAVNENYFPVFGQKVYFKVPKGKKEFEIKVSSGKTWAAYGWHPEIKIYSPTGEMKASAKGPGDIAIKVKADGKDTGKLWSIGPVSSVSAADKLKLWAKPLRPYKSVYPLGFYLPGDFEQYVSPGEELFFIPEE
ncbi:MAG: hypothetical protein ACYTFY_22645, partial [Planctomycetota bacterium]